MNKFQKVIAQLVKDDKNKGNNASFREIRNAYKSVWKSDVFEDLVLFKQFNKKLPI